MRWSMNHKKSYILKQTKTNPTTKIITKKFKSKLKHKEKLMIDHTRANRSSKQAQIHNIE